LPFAVNCLNQSVKTANRQFQVENKIFSPHNWLKKNDSVNAESLVASTVVDLMDGAQSLGGKNMREIMKVGADQFELRWKAE